MSRFYPDGYVFDDAVSVDSDNIRQTALEHAIALAKRNSLNDKFAQAWAAIKGQQLTAEHKFHPTRKWRFDFAHLDTKIAIELEGLTHKGGRHQSVKGYTADVEKYNEATLLGWTVFRLTKSQIDIPTLRQINYFIEQKQSRGVLQ
jgi:very-short-patch-repair endonuclease